MAGTYPGYACGNGVLRVSKVGGDPVAHIGVGRPSRAALDPWGEGFRCYRAGLLPWPTLQAIKWGSCGLDAHGCPFFVVVVKGAPHMARRG